MIFPRLCAGRNLCAAIVLLVAFIPTFAVAQASTERFMIGGDVGWNINFFSTDAMLDGKHIPDFESEFLTHATGTSVCGDLLCSIPMKGAGAAVITAHLDELFVSRHAFVTIPCAMYSESKQHVATNDALTEQEYRLSVTALSLTAAFQYQNGHAFASGGAGGGMYLAHKYEFTSKVIRPDSCFYDFFGEKSHVMKQEAKLAALNFRLPISIRIGILIPVANNVYFSPSIGLNLGVVPMNASGATITSIQPAMGLRLAP